MDVSMADNLCSVWEIQDSSEEYRVSPSSVSVPHFCFVVKVDLTYVSMELDGEDGEEEDGRDFVYSCVTRNDQFKIPRQLLLQEESWEVTVSNILTSMKFPSHAQANMAEKIRDFAVTIANEKRNLDRKVVYLAVDIQATTVEEEDDCDEDGILEDASMDTVELDAIPVPVLEKVRVESNNFEDKQCVVCMEGFSEGTELSRLPCYHVYHRHCILDWLLESSLCPLCRFDMEI